MNRWSTNGARRISLWGGAVWLTAALAVAADGPASSPTHARPAADSSGQALGQEAVDASWLTRVEAGIRDQEYRFSLGSATYRPGRGDVWQAPNRALDVRLYLDDSGVEVLERTVEGAPTVMRLALVRWGRGKASEAVPSGALREKDGSIERLRGDVVETCRNGAAGLELTWRVEALPVGEGPLVLAFDLGPASARPRGGGVEIVSPGGRRLLLEAVKVVDGAGRIIPTELVVTDRHRLELRVQDENATTPLYLKGLLTGFPDTVLEANQVGAQMGASVASAGDVNGDGFADVIVGAPYFDHGQTNEGAAFVFHGSAAGITGSSPADADATLEANQVEARLGSSVATAGDVNGDGFADVIVGAAIFDAGQTNEGAAFVFHGSAAGLTGSGPADADAVLEGGQADAQMGSSVATAGDVDGDGFADVIVGAPFYDDGETNEGAAFVFHGSAAGLTGTGPADADAVLEANQANAWMGESVGAAGDVNGDGFSDIIVGARLFDHGETDEGAAFVFHGSVAGITGTGPADADAVLEADQASAMMGSSVGTAGDVNGDGFSDIIVGARLFDHGETDEGAAFVFYGSAAGVSGSGPTDADAVLEANQAFASMGSSVGTAGDVNGDGFADVIVGAPFFDVRESNDGAAFVYFGSAAGVTGSGPADAVVTFPGNQVDARLGSSVATAGDVNGDGLADLIVGGSSIDNGEANEGAAFIVLGSAAAILGSGPADADAVLEGNQAYAAMGNSVATAGDVNGDGFADVIVSASGFDHGEANEGAAFVFHGSAAGITGTGPADADAVLEGNQSEASMGDSVATAGDVNGDGFADVIVGAFHFDHGEADEGAAFVFHGSSGGITGTGPADADAVLEGNQAGAQMGDSVATAGDVNGDGFADLLVGATFFDHGEPDEGAGFVFLGSAAGITGTGPADANAVLEANQASAWLGQRVGTAGDVNGDGYADVIVGAPYFDGGQTDEGAAFVFYGSAGGISGGGPADANAVLESNQAYASMGRSVGTAGDVNGDGYADLIVGALSFGHGQASEGAAFVFLGSATGIIGSNPTDAHAMLEANQVAARMGSSVAAAGDVNGDGYADVIVGAPYFDGGQTDEGAAFVFLGSAAGITGTGPANADAVLETDQGSSKTGHSVSTAGDINGDGFADVVVGAWRFQVDESYEGAAFVFLGNSEGRPVLARQYGGGRAVQPWGLSETGGGFSVRMQAGSPRGRESARLQVETCPSGVAWGSALCSDWLSPSWVDTTASPDGVSLELTTTDLEPGLYRWRARTLYRPLTADQPGVLGPPNPAHGPWRRLGAQSIEADIRTGAGVVVDPPLFADDFESGDLSGWSSHS